MNPNPQLPNQIEAMVHSTNPQLSNSNQSLEMNEMLNLFEEPNPIPIITVEQVDPKSKVTSHNFRTLLRISVQVNGKYVPFKPTHIGLITAKRNPTISFFLDADLPTIATLKWERFGAKCYKKSCKGRYLVVLEVVNGEETQHFGLIVHVGRTNQKGCFSTKDLPFFKYSWFEIRDVASFVDETNPQLIYLWDESFLSQNQRVSYFEVKKDNVVDDEMVPQIKRKEMCSEETTPKRKKTKV